MCYMGVLILPGKGQFWRWANMGMSGRFTWGMDLWGDDAAFYQITSISCFYFTDTPTSAGPLGALCLAHPRPASFDR